MASPMYAPWLKQGIRTDMRGVIGPCGRADERGAIGQQLEISVGHRLGGSSTARSPRLSRSNARSQNAAIVRGSWLTRSIECPPGVTRDSAAGSVP